MHFQNQKSQSITSLSATDFALPLPTHPEFHAALLLVLCLYKESQRTQTPGWKFASVTRPSSSDIHSVRVSHKGSLLIRTSASAGGTPPGSRPAPSSHYQSLVTTTIGIPVYKATLSSSCAEERCNSMYQALYSNSANRHVLKYLLPSENNNPGCPSLYRVVAGTWCMIGTKYLHVFIYDIYMIVKWGLRP